MTPPPTLGVILAGGLSRRMGGQEKSLLTLGGQTLLDHVRERLAPQCESLILNANGSSSHFATMGLPVVPDVIPGHQGPLAGILTALEWTAVHRPRIEWVVSVPGDCPFLPEDLVGRLHAARIAENRMLACAKSGDWRHPVVGIWPISLRADLRHALVKEGLHKIEIWTARHGVAIAEWPDQPLDPFFNVNTPEDRDRAAAIAAHNRDA